jgi:hypothetical protein
MEEKLKVKLLNLFELFRLNLLISTPLIWWMVDHQLSWVLFGPLSCTSRYVVHMKAFDNVHVYTMFTCSTNRIL